MSRVSCIEHPAGDPFVMLRRDYMALCDGDACTAMLLAAFEGWTNHKLKEREERGRGDLWIYRSRDDLRGEDLCGALGLTRLDNSLDELLRLGYVERRRNPRLRWDRMWQYRLNITQVQEAVNRLKSQSEISEDGALESENGSSGNGASNLRNPTSNTLEPTKTPAETETQDSYGSGRETYGVTIPGGAT